MSVRTWPIDYVELCLCLHDALCVLDDAATALQYTRYAETVLNWVDPARYRDCEERVHSLEINTIRGIGVVYNNLDLPTQAAWYFQQARRTTAFVRRREDWIVHVCRDTLSTIAKQPRFTLSEVEGLANQALESMGDTNRELNTLLLKAKLGECYLAYRGRRDYAGPLLDAVIEETERSTVLGPLHRTIIYRTYALLCRKRADRAGLAHWAARALSVAEEAGLVREARTIRRDVLGEPKLHHRPSG